MSKAKYEKITTPEGRVSFPSVFKATRFDDSQEAKYEMTLLFPKGTDLSHMKELAKKAVVEKWGDKIPANLRSPFRDGNDKPNLDGYADMTFVKMISKQRPGVVDQNLNLITEANANDFYGGCWARATVVAYTYGGPGTKFKPGVAFGLNNIQKTRDDDTFSGKVSAEADFEAIEGVGESEFTETSSDDTGFLD